MQEVRHAAYLLDGPINDFAGLVGYLLFRWRRVRPKRFAQDHLGHGKLLSQPIVQVARDAAPLLVLHRQQADRKPAQLGGSFVDHLLQFCRAVANRLFQHLAVVDVGTSAVPLDDLSLQVANRQGASAKPTIGAIARANAIFGLVVSSRFDTTQPVRHGVFLVIWMHIVQPARAIRRPWVSSGVIVESITDVIPGTVRLPAENNVWCSVDDGVEFLILARQLAVELLQRLTSLL